MIRTCEKIMLNVSTNAVSEMYLYCYPVGRFREYISRLYLYIRCTGQVPAGPVHTNSVKIIKCGTMETEIIKTNVYVTNNNKSEDFRPRYYHILFIILTFSYSLAQQLWGL